MPNTPAPNDPNHTTPAMPRGWLARSLDAVERLGNRLPDPAVLFVLLMILAWVVSALLSNMTFAEIDPRSGKPIEIRNLLAGESLTAFMATMVATFTSFPPLGVVLVAMLGLGEVGADRFHHGADADAARRVARHDPGRVPRRR